MRTTTNKGLMLYDTNDKMYITPDNNSLNNNMVIIDEELYALYKQINEEIKGFINNLINDLDVERKRIDSILSLPEGSTTCDAELADARIDKDGITHESVGVHIRTVTSNLATALSNAVTSLSNTISESNNRVIDITKGGTGATTAAEAIVNLNITPANIGAAPSNHTHSMDDVRLETIPLDLGGTGANNVQDAKTNLGIMYSEVTPTDIPTTGEGTVCFVKNEDPLPILKGGTGADNAEQALMNLGGISMKLLWENASPTSEFGTQDITINNLQDYDYLVVNIRQSINYSYQHAEIICISNDVTNSIIVAPLSAVNNLLIAYARVVSITKSTNIFSLGSGAKHDTSTQTAITDNTCCIPISIYGIKGVK